MSPSCVPLYRGADAKLAAAGIALDSGAPITVERRPAPHGRRAAPRTPWPRDARLRRPAAALRPRRLAVRSQRPGEFPDNAAAVRRARQGGCSSTGGARSAGPSTCCTSTLAGAPAAIYAPLHEVPAAIVTTIHNLAYRGILPRPRCRSSGFRGRCSTSSLVSWSSFYCTSLKAGLALADAVTTVKLELRARDPHARARRGARCDSSLRRQAAGRHRQRHRHGGRIRRPIRRYRRRIAADDLAGKARVSRAARGRVRPAGRVRRAVDRRDRGDDDQKGLDRSPTSPASSPAPARGSSCSAPASPHPGAAVRWLPTCSAIISRSHRVRPRPRRTGSMRAPICS